MYLVPESALQYGFSNDPVGTHTSRTMMLSELVKLLAACPESSTIDDYRVAVIEENVLGKHTVTTRTKSFRHLRELYGLSTEMLLFRAMRELWDVSTDAQPLLALLCATARDPILRGTADLILESREGELITPQMISDTAANAFPNRYNPNSLAKIGRNAASSWQQSGHLEGKLKKHRVKVKCQPMAAVYATLLGYLCDARGELALESIWTSLLDVPEHVLRSQLDASAKQGYLEYRSGGGVTQIGFRHLLQDVVIEL